MAAMSLRFSGWLVDGVLFGVPDAARVVFLFSGLGGQVGEIRWVRVHGVSLPCGLCLGVVVFRVFQGVDRLRRVAG